MMSSVRPTGHRLCLIAVPDAERFGQEIAIVRTSGEYGPLAEAFGKFFLDAARSAYPAAGFTASDKFEYGKILQLSGRKMAMKQAKIS